MECENIFKGTPLNFLVNTKREDILKSLENLHGPRIIEWVGFNRDGLCYFLDFRCDVLFYFTQNLHSTKFTTKKD